MTTFKSNDFNPNATGFTPKIMQPGKNYARIIDLKLETPHFAPEKNGYFVTLVLEGKDEGEDFTGLNVDKDNPSLGTYRGQVANVNNGRYPFSDFEYNGKSIKRDDQIFKWVNNLAKQMGVLEKMNADGASAETIEDYIQLVKTYVVNPELWGYFTIAGKEYFTDGYERPNYNLFFPKAEGKLLPFSALEDGEHKLINFLEFDATKHIVKVTPAETKPVDEFDAAQGHSSLQL